VGEGGLVSAGHGRARAEIDFWTTEGQVSCGSASSGGECGVELSKGVRHRHWSKEFGGLANRDERLEDRLIHELSR